MNQCFSGIAKINSTLIVAPFRGNTFIEYDIEEDRQYSIECKAVDKELANMELKVNFCTQCCNRIFFYTGYNKPRLIELKVKGHHYEI